MTIEQNLAIAYYKNRPRGLQPGISKRPRAVPRKARAARHGTRKPHDREKVKSLSGGQRQSLTLFMAVIANPKLLLLDEHTAALDPAAAEKVLELTNLFRRAGGHVYADDHT